MSYLDKYKRMVSVDNMKTTKDLLLEAEILSFQEYLNGAPNQYAYNKYKDTNKFFCTIQDTAFNDNKNGDEKILCVENSSILVMGDLIECDGKIWLISFEEHNTVKSHKTFIMRPTNNSLKYIVNKNQVNEAIFNVPAIVTNQTLYTVGLNDGTYFNTGDTKLSCIIGVSKDTMYIARDMRFIFNTNSEKVAYFITYVDTISKEGLLICTLKETIIVEEDDLEKGIAFNDMGKISIKDMDNTTKIVAVQGTNVDYINFESLKSYHMLDDKNIEPVGRTFSWRLEQSVENPLITPADLITKLEIISPVSCRLTSNDKIKGYFNLISICNEDKTEIVNNLRIKDSMDL
ncbi:hypothetical protein [Clostridium tagluense]|uniref:Uncharacterized protein n=1 Tax=Clostridium tagluense TaxID=360422 RepID=A0A401ULN3_9CLOT|nr:hypothetical protein [Clostridium tagluense]GCD10438.1 hypothetical protein Ctaglu_20610 [Clostridium tagluense]